MKHHQAWILVIEDEDDVRTSIVHFLRSAGFTVVDASDGNRGMTQLHKHDIKLVVTDILMPEMDGLEVIIEMRKSYPATKIIAMSKGSELLCLAKALGAHATVAKPFEAQDLLDAIRRVELEQSLEASANTGSSEDRTDDAGPAFSGLSPRKPWISCDGFHLASAL